MKKSWIASAVLALAAMGAGAQSNESLEVKSLEVISGAPVSSFTGEARNVAGRTIKDAVISFNLYDRDGNLVGNAQTHASNLEPDAVWKFQSTPKVQFSTVKAVDVKAY